MKNIDFKRMEIYTDCAKKNCIVADMSEQFADIIYTCGNGIRAKLLAEKIFRSNSEDSYDDSELKLIREYAALCSPAFIDAINKILE